MESGNQPITVITGGGRGIGAATAIRLARPAITWLSRTETMGPQPSASRRRSPQRASGA